MRKGYAPRGATSACRSRGLALFARNSPLRATNRSQRAVIKIADLVPVRKTHSIAQPVESVGKDHRATRPRGDTLEINGRFDDVAGDERELTVVRFCQ